MAKSDNLTDFIVDIADAIRYTTNTASEIHPQNFSNLIRGLKAGILEVDLISDTTLYGEELATMNAKKVCLARAIDHTIIDGESVYKMIQQKNTANNSYIDILMYTEEGDAGGYYYVLNGIDNHLIKVMQS